MAKDNSENSGNRHKIHKVFPTNCFFRCNFSLKNSIQFGNSSNCSLFTGENTAINDSMVTVLVSVGFTKKRFGHQATLMIFFSRPPSRVELKFSNTAANVLFLSNCTFHLKYGFHHSAKYLLVLEQMAHSTSFYPLTVQYHNLH